VELILVRHGLPVRTEAPADGRSGPPDPELSATGHDQARLVAQALAEEDIVAIYSSPLRRAVRTAEPLAATLGLPIVIDDGLHEVDFGEESYIPVEELGLDDPRTEMWRRVMRDQGSELIADFRRRVGTAISAIIARHPGETVVVACHAGVITAALASLLKLTETFVFQVDYASLTRIRVSRDSRVGVRSVNEFGHLEETR
jgi:probable phosphoglycerate mutase